MLFRLGLRSRLGTHEMGKNLGGLGARPAAACMVFSPET